MLRLLFIVTAILRGDWARAADLAWPIVLIFLCLTICFLFTQITTLFPRALQTQNIPAPQLQSIPNNVPTFTPTARRTSIRTTTPNSFATSIAATITHLETQLAQQNTPSTLSGNASTNLQTVPSSTHTNARPTITPDYGNMTLEEWCKDRVCNTPDPNYISPLVQPCDTFLYNKWKNGKSDRYVPECTPTPSTRGQGEKYIPPTIPIFNYP